MTKIISIISLFLFFSILHCADIRLKNTFEKNAEGWNSPKYWNGTLTHKNQSMFLKAENRNGKNFGRCSKMVLSDRHLTGSVFELFFDGRGQGDLKVGCMIFPYPPQKPYLKWFHSTKLTARNSTYKFKIDLSQTQTERIALVFECGKNAEFYFDNVMLKKLPSAPSVLAENILFETKDLKNGIINLKSALIITKGKNSLTSKGALSMDGKTNEIILNGRHNIDVHKGFTVDLICRKTAPGGSSDAEIAYDGLFQYADSFILARYGRSFYLLIHDGKKYQKAFLSNRIFTDKTDKNAHHIAMTCKYHEAIDQGEIWTEVQIYLDGKSVVNKKLPKIKMPVGGNNMEFATASKFGRIWNFGGEVYGGGVFPRVLTENEIRQRVLQYKNIVTPDFPVSAELTAENKAPTGAA